MKFAFTIASALAVATVASAAAPQQQPSNVAEVAAAYAGKIFHSHQAKVSKAGAKVVQRKKNHAYIPNTYMVELEAGANGEVDPITHVTRSLTKRAPGKYTHKNVKKVTTIRSSLFNGVSIKLDADHDVNDLAEIPGAVKIFPVRINRRPQAIKATKKPVVGQDITPHTMTGVDKLHAQGKFGKGVKVAVIDTGIYWKHPALGGCFGKGCKVAFGYDLVGDEYDADALEPIIKPDSDPMDDCSDDSHGTHVAGIIGASATNIKVPGFVPAIPFVGVAPEATLGHYRIFGCSGNNGDDVMAKAIYKAFEDGADVISISVGEAGAVENGSMTPEAIERVSRAGVHILVSAGNDGAQGLYTVGDPALSKSAIAVASIDNLAKIQPSIYDSNNNNYAYSPASSGAWTSEVTQSIFVADADDGCAAKQYPSAAGKVLMVKFNSQCGSKAICSAAFAQKASGCLLYNVGSIAGSDLLPSAQVELDVAEKLIALVKANPAAIFRFSNKGALTPSQSAGVASDFTSYGTDAELHFKPNIAGVGGDIYSTVSANAAKIAKQQDAYLYLSGTSMACPYVAGTMALLVQEKGLLTTEQALAYLSNSASNVKIFNSTLVDTTARVGAGLVNIERSLAAKTIVTPPSIALNDTIRMKKSYTINIQNTGSKVVTYKLDHVPSALATGAEAGSDMPITTINYTPDYAKVDISPKSLKLKAGKSATVTLKFTAPAKADPKLFPIYSGYIRATPSDGSAAVTVPYMGTKGDFSQAKMLVEKTGADEEAYKTGIYNADGALIAANDVVNGTAGVDVRIVLGQATRIVFADVISAAPGLPGYKPSLGVIVPVDNSGKNTPYSFTVAAYRVNQPRNAVNEGQGYHQSYPLPWFGSVTLAPADGATDIPRQHGENQMEQRLPAGKYQVRFSALKHFGNSAKPEDFEVVTSPVFNLIY
ncbi:hypothetical protein PhCBS80983_g04046 [Powellomyces hirtus]|uniref:Peptidase S8/S53 domain-containing protein n=1 Tax=Powellomyces hirtus TaxID=109895 RepID=A0A507DZD4_9FUNG|nr:hypothetical protein PhCBS80983_g04046 [Powellomyces hirtus]